MITYRNIPLSIVLTILTCGIYGLYWYAMVTDEISLVTEEPGTSGVMSVVLSLITCGIYGVYWGWKNGEKLDASRARHGVVPGSFPVLFLLLNLFGLLVVTLAIAQNELNKYTPNV